ncbi:MAG: hypothetical protein AB8G05_00485 [Oligoflexales bacterium]
MTDEKSSLFHLDRVYKVLSLLTTMYDKALEFEYHESRHKIWQDCLFSAIDSIENFYELWEVANRELEYGVPAEPLPRSLTWIEKSCERVQLISSRISPWTAVSRLPKILVNSEKYSLVSLRKLAEHYPCDVNELCCVMDQHLFRIEKMASLSNLFSRDKGLLEQLPKNLFI